MNTLVSSAPRAPWYRHPWPWILMTGPAVVIVAGVFTTWLAFTRADPLVSEDYYRKGLAAPQTIASSNYATALGLQADLSFSGEKISLKLSTQTGKLPPPSHVTLTLSHPTRAGLDQVVVLLRDDNEYRGTLRLPQSGNWLVLIEDDQKAWRLLGKTVLPTERLSIGRATFQRSA